MRKVGALLAGFSVCGVLLLATEPLAQRDEAAKAKTEEQAKKQAERTGNRLQVLMASKIKDKDILRSDGEKIGTLQDLVADSKDGDRLLAIVKLDEAAFEQPAPARRTTGDAAEEEVEAAENGEQAAARTTRIEDIGDHVFMIPFEVLMPLGEGQEASELQTGTSATQRERQAQTVRQESSKDIKGFVLTADAQQRLPEAHHLPEDQWMRQLDVATLRGSFTAFNLQNRIEGLSEKPAKAAKKTAAKDKKPAEETARRAQVAADNQEDRDERVSEQFVLISHLIGKDVQSTQQAAAKQTKARAERQEEQAEDAADEAETDQAEERAEQRADQAEKRAERAEERADAMGEKLGTIEDIALDPHEGRIAFVLAQLSEVETLKDELVALPWQAVQTVPGQDILAVSIPRSQLEGAPVYDREVRDDAIQMTERNRLGSVYEHYEATPYFLTTGSGTTETSRARNDEQDEAEEADETTARGRADKPRPENVASTIKAGRVIGFNVRNPEGENLGDIEDLVIDPNTGTITYAVLAHGGWLGIGGKYFAVPWDALQLEADQKRFTLNVTRETLANAEGFDRNNWPETPNHELFARGTRIETAATRNARQTASERAEAEKAADDGDSR
jgi:sporulation protein YlmC with PRC-barrel domain